MASQPKNNPNDLEAQLAGVLEQDGITMISSQGIHRRVKRVKKIKKEWSATPPINFDYNEISAQGDQVADFDVATVDLLVKSTEPAKAREVLIKIVETPRSAFVVSLRGLPLSGKYEREDRYPAHYALEAEPNTELRVRETNVYGSFSQDLTVTGHDPRSFGEQFTPDNFFEAHRQSYGALRQLKQACNDAWSDIASLFKRVERVEQRISDEVRDTLTIVEVPRLSFSRSLIGFAGLLLVVTLPANAIALYRTASDTRNTVESAGNAALQELENTKSAGSLPSSLESLQRASTNFRVADAVLADSNALAVGIASVLPSRYRSARALFEVGDKSSEAARLIAVAFEKVFKDETRRLDERLDVLAMYARGALPLLVDASKAASTIDPKTLPEDKRETISKLSSNLETAIESVRDFAGMADLLSALSGKERARKYLLVFQNNTELRPTGGFMGSVAEITLDRGAVKKIFVPPGGTYDMKGQLLAHVISPQPLHLINPHWQFQDANWSPDFPTSAEKIRWFWSKSGGPTLDGVVALNASFVERLLEVTGPIDMPAYGKVIDHTNFLTETQKAVEIEYDRAENKPKKFIGDLADEMFKRLKLFTAEEWLKTASMLSEGIQTKEIQVALFSDEEQAQADHYGWGGRIKDTNGDSLAMIEANIAGQKTDGVIAEDVKFVAEIQPDGSIIDTVTLRREHLGSKGELFRGVRNVSYLRTYVPKGSQLLSASGFESPPPNLFKKPDADYQPDPDITEVEDSAVMTADGVEVAEEGSRTVIGGWLQLEPGRSQIITYRYRLPFTVSDIHSKLEAGPDEGNSDRGAYLLLLSSQSGKITRKIDASVVIPAIWKIDWRRGTNSSDGPIAFSGNWDRDRVMAVLLAPLSE